MSSDALSIPSKPQVSKTLNIVLWILQILAALAFLFAGFAKLSGNPMMVQMFDKIGLGQWFRYLTGGLEFVCAILLLIPGAAAIGAGLLAITMLCAIVTHLTKIGGSPAAPIVLFLLTAFIAWMRRGSLSR